MTDKTPSPAAVTVHALETALTRFDELVATFDVASIRRDRDYLKGYRDAITDLLAAARGNV